MRLAGDELRLGLQLVAPGLVSGVRASLRKAAVPSVARTVLSALGPRLGCDRCGEVLAVHVPRLTGVDEVHGLVCPACGALLRSYLRFGPPEGLEGFAAVALRAGLTSAVRVRLGHGALTFGMLPAERSRLTAAELLSRFEALCLLPHQLHLPPGSLSVRVGGRRLAPEASLPRRGALSFAVARTSARSAGWLLGQLRGRVARRFSG